MTAWLVAAPKRDGESGLWILHTLNPACILHGWCIHSIQVQYGTLHLQTMFLKDHQTTVYSAGLISASKRQAFWVVGAGKRYSRQYSCCRYEVDWLHLPTSWLYAQWLWCPKIYILLRRFSEGVVKVAASCGALLSTAAFTCVPLCNIVH